MSKTPKGRKEHQKRELSRKRQRAAILNKQLDAELKRLLERDK